MAVAEREAQKGHFSSRFRHLRAPEIRTASGEVIHFNRGSRLGQRVVETFLSPSGHVHTSGLENIADLRKLVEEGENSSNPPKVFVTVSHESHLDLPRVIESLGRYGGEGLRRRLFVVIGNRLAGNFWVDQGSRQYPWVRAPQIYNPKFDGPLSEEELAKRNTEDFALLKDSKRAINYLFSQGRIGMIAPSGTRKEPDGVPQVVSYFKDCIILPVHIKGSAKVLPPGSGMPKRGNIDITFGPMYSFNDIEEQYRDLPKDQQRSAAIKEVMRRIYSLSPRQ